MSLETHIASGTAGELDLFLIEISHPTWTSVLRYAEDTQDWTVTIDGVQTTFESTGHEVDAPPTDDTGIDSSSISVPDLDLVLWRRLERLSQTGDADPVTVTVHWYLSTDLTAPAVEPRVLRMSNPSRSGRIVSFDASTANVLNRDAPNLRFTWANSPGLRR